MSTIPDRTVDRMETPPGTFAAELHSRLLEDSMPKQSDVIASSKTGAQAEALATVTWHRANGETVVEKNEKITKIPCNPREGIDPERQEQLDCFARNLLSSHAGDKGVNFKGLGDIIQTIGKDRNLTEREKINVWDTIVKDVNDKKVSWNKVGANPFTLNNNRTWRIAHELISFDEGYHADKVNQSDLSNGLQLILHNAGSTVEDIFFRGVGLQSHNDLPNEIASRYQIKCLRAYLKDGFQGYADNWRRDFVSPLPQERNDYYYDKIADYTRRYGFPGSADRNEVGTLLEDYRKEIKQRDGSAKAPESISLYF